MSDDTDNISPPSLPIRLVSEERRPSTGSHGSNTSRTPLIVSPVLEKEPQIPSLDEIQDALASLPDDALSHKEQPDHVKALLRSFGRFKVGTEVSMYLITAPTSVTRSGESKELQAPSLLLAFSTWMQIWYKILESARRENRNRNGVLKEQQDFDWLLNYIRDYLTLDHPRFADDEVEQLIESVVQLCLVTSRHSDINSAIDIIHTFLANSEIPSSRLEKTLTVLCASATNLHEPPIHLSSCLRLLLTKVSREKTIQILDSFIRHPTAENKGSKLSYARGAVRLIRILYNDTYEGAYLINMRNFISALNYAGQQQLPRYCSDILSACAVIVSSDERRSEVLAADWKFLFLDTIGKVLKTSLKNIPQGPSTTSLLAQVDSQDSESNKSLLRHGRERDAADTLIRWSVEQVWPDVSVEQKLSAVEYFLIRPEDLTNSQALMVVGYIYDQKLCLPSHPGWESMSEVLLQCFVTNQRWVSDVRLRAVKAFSEVPILELKDEEYPNPTMKVHEKRVLNIIQHLLRQLLAEKDDDFIRHLTTALEYMSLEQSKYPERTLYTSHLIEQLNTILMNDGPSKTTEWQLQNVADLLVSVFLHSLYHSTGSTTEAFEVLNRAASLKCRFQRVRLVAMRILFRIRVDSEGFVYIDSSPSSVNIAAALCRTEESAAAFNQDLPTQRHSGSSASLSSKAQTMEQLWIYPQELAKTSHFESNYPRTVGLQVSEATNTGVYRLDIGTWLFNIIRALQNDNDWETYSYILVHLAAQLENVDLFRSELDSIVKLRQVACEQTVNSTFREPPQATGLKKSDVAICFFHFLTPLIAFATMKHQAIQKGFGDDLVRAFLSGISGNWEGTSRACIHALSISSLEIPLSVAGMYPNIIDRMSKSMTQSHLTMHILEFLAQVARLPEVHSNFNQDEITMIFGICIQFLEKTREQRSQPSHPSQPSQQRSGTPGARQSGLAFRRPPYRASMLQEFSLHQYASALAYHTMIFWFLSLRLEIRASYVAWIVRRLTWKDARGEDAIDEPSEVFVDMMQRTAFSDLGETKANPKFADEGDGTVNTASWIVGLSIITAESAGHTGITQITKRQASGTTYASYQQLSRRLPAHHAPSHTEIRIGDSEDAVTTEMLPSHILLQMVATAAPVRAADQPIPLPNDDQVIRSLAAIDRIPTVDSFKIGVMFIDKNQTQETEYLPNTKGSADYDRFLKGLGYVVSLEPPLEYNSQGLQSPQDGTHTIAWRDRVTEIVYHITTMMPTDLEEDPQCIAKKAHVGNCHVNVIFNRSGIPWKLENFRSQLNYVNIVIEPAARMAAEFESAQEVTEKAASYNGEQLPDFYRVCLITKEDFPNISPAAMPRVISATQLAQFVRVIALNAFVFSQAWNAKDIDTEFPSTWRARLQQIKTLRERIISRMESQNATGASAHSNPGLVLGPAGGRRTPVLRDDATSRMDGGLASQLDFSRWTL